MMKFQEIAGYVLILKGLGVAFTFALLDGLAVTDGFIPFTAVGWTSLFWPLILLGLFLVVCGLGLAAAAQENA